MLLFKPSRIEHPLAAENKAQLPAGTKRKDYAKYNRCESKTPNSPHCRRVNCSDLLAGATISVVAAEME
jgi:hypothetical protein